MTAVAERPRVLAVDDSEEQRELYELALELAGYTVMLASNGQEALDLARKIRFDVIVTDVSMPVMDGLELLGRLPHELAPPLPPVIVVSGFDMTEATAMRLGAFRFLSKPLDSDDLLSAVEQALRHTTPAEEALHKEKERIAKSRERAATAASVALRDVDFATPDVTSAVQGFAEWIAEYFGFGATALAFVEGGDLRVRAVSRGSVIAAGTVWDGHALYSSGVLACGASLVISDAAAYPFASERAKQYGIRSFVGVPLLSNAIPVGTICLFDAAPRTFSAEDLLLLEEFGRGALHRENALPSAVERVGILTPGTFQRMLTAELALHRRNGGSLDLAIVEQAEVCEVDDVLAALGRATTRARLGVARYGNSFALYKRDPDVTGASRAICDALGAIAAVATLQAAGWLSLGDHLPSPSAQDLLELGRGALEQARAGARGTIERFELKREPWRGLTAAPTAPTAPD